MTIYKQIKGFIPNSLVDWDGKVASVIFLSGCNFNCGFCSNKKLASGKTENIDFKKIEKYLENNRDFIDGVVITGGEPCLNSEIGILIKKLKELGFKVKLDTNGSQPGMLKQLVEEKMLDYVAMDIKANKELYPKIAGMEVEIKNIEDSIKILKDSGIDFELRTTLAPILPELRWMSVQEAKEMANWIFELAGRRRWYLQKFIAREKEEMGDEQYGLENLKIGFQETPIKIMEELKEIVEKQFDCRLR